MSKMKMNTRNTKYNSSEIRNNKEDLRKDAQNEQQTRHTEPKDRVLKSYLRITYFASDKDEGENGNNN